MATRTNKVEVEITAIDEASPKIERLEKKIDGLEADEARITVRANTERLEQQLDTARQKLAGLDGDEASVQARLVGTLEKDLEDAQSLLRSLDGQTGTVSVKVDDNASRVLDDIQSELRQIDGTSVEANVGVTGGGGIGAGGVAAGGAAAVGGALLAGGINATQTALLVSQIARQTGASVEEAGRLVAIWQRAGLDTNDLLDVLLQVNQVLAEHPDLAEQLGVNINASTDAIDVFYQALQGVNEEGDKLAQLRLSGQLFGEQGVKQVGALEEIVGNIEESARNLDESEFIGQDDVDNARQLNDEYIEAKGHWQQIELAALRAATYMTNGLASLKDAEWQEFFWGLAGVAPKDVRATGARNMTAAELTEPWDENAPNVLITEPTSWTRNALQPLTRQIVNIINPAGTPAAYVDGTRIYQRRNGMTGSIQ